MTKYNNITWRDWAVFVSALVFTVCMAALFGYFEPMFTAAINIAGGAVLFHYCYVRKWDWE